RIARHPPTYTLLPYTTLFRSCKIEVILHADFDIIDRLGPVRFGRRQVDPAGIKPSADRRIDQRVRQNLVVRRQGPGRFLERDIRSEEHTSELQSRENLVCRLL